MKYEEVWQKLKNQDTEDVSGRSQTLRGRGTARRSLHQKLNLYNVSLKWHLSDKICLDCVHLETLQSELWQDQVREDDPVGR